MKINLKKLFLQSAIITSSLSMYAQSSKNLLQVSPSYSSYSGLRMNFAYERAISEKHKVSLFANFYSRYQQTYGIGYKYQLWRNEKWELYTGMNLGQKRYDYRLQGFSKINAFYYSPNIEARYKINKRFQVQMNISKDIFTDQTYGGGGLPSGSLGVGYKF